MLGNGRCECFCFDGVTRLGHIRGKMRKKVWITAGDIILVAKRDFQDEKVDIVHKYSADEARNLKQYGELPENARINETAVDMAMADDNDDDDIGIAFDDIQVWNGLSVVDSIVAGQGGGEERIGLRAYRRKAETNKRKGNESRTEKHKHEICA